MVWYFGLIIKMSPLKIRYASKVLADANMVEGTYPTTVEFPNPTFKLMEIRIVQGALPTNGDSWPPKESSGRRPAEMKRQAAARIVENERADDEALRAEITLRAAAPPPYPSPPAYVQRTEAAPEVEDVPNPAEVITIVDADDDDFAYDVAIPPGKSETEVIENLTVDWSGEQLMSPLQRSRSPKQSPGDRSQGSPYGMGSTAAEGTCTPTSAGGFGKVDASRTPALPKNNRREHVGELEERSTGHSDYRNTHDAQEQTRVEVVDHPQSRGINTRSPESSPAVLLRRTHNPYAGFRKVEADDAQIGPTLPRGKAPSTNPSYSGTAIQGGGHLLAPTQAGYRDGIDARVDDSLQTRMYPSAAQGGHHDQFRPNSQYHVQTREGSQGTRPVHSTYVINPDQIRSFDSTIPLEPKRDGISEKPDRSNAVLSPQKSVPNTRATFRPKGRPPAYGDDWNRRGNPDAILGSHAGFDPQAVSELERCQQKGRKGNAGDRRESLEEFVMRKLKNDPNANSCPSWSDLRPREKNADHLPLNVKPEVMSSVNINEVKKLQLASQQVSAYLHNALRWIEDDSRYDFGLSKTFYNKYNPRLSDEDVSLLMAAGKFRRCKPICSVKAFAVPEWAKKRRRPIFWPDINQLIDKLMLQPSMIPKKAIVRRQVQRDCWSLQYDFKSWYDQIPLAPTISPFFSFDGKDCLAQLPMGFRPAVEVAQAITLALTDFELPDGVQCIAYIDNVRFVGPKKTEVIRAGEYFKSRCQSVGAIIGTESEISQEDEFLGERYDYVSATRRLTDKVLQKIDYILQALEDAEELTFRQLAAVFGVLFYASNVLDVQLSKKFEALRYYRLSMSKMMPWDKKIRSMPEEINDDLKNWCCELKRNLAVPAFTEPTTCEPDLTLYIDASAYGWGCVSMKDAARPKIFAAPWSQADKEKYMVEHSVTSEPLGAERAILAAVTKDTRKVHVFTDHSPMLFSQQRKYGKAKSYNDLVIFLQENYPNTEFIFSYVKGEDNPADLSSRGKTVV